MKTVIKLAMATAIFAFVFSCSAPEEEITPSESTTTNVVFTKNDASHLVNKTVAFYDDIEKNVTSEKDLEYAENSTKKLLVEYEAVLNQEGGVKEVEKAIEILEEMYRTNYQSNQRVECIDQLRQCVRIKLIKLALHVVQGGSVSEGVDEAVNGVLGCVGGYLLCLTDQ